MVLKDYLAISGHHGLFKFIARGRNSMIVEHLETGKRTSAFGSAKVSSLEEISIYAKPEDIPLAKVFDAIYDRENGGPCPDEKSDISVLRNYFGEIVPDYDKERVYDSDIRKVFRWYNILHELGLLVREEPEKETGKKEETGEPVTGQGEKEAHETSSEASGDDGKTAASEGSAKAGKGGKKKGEKKPKE